MRDQQRLAQCVTDLRELQETLSGLSDNSQVFIQDLERSLASKDAQMAKLVEEEERLIAQHNQLERSEQLSKRRAANSAPNNAPAASPAPATH